MKKRLTSILLLLCLLVTALPAWAAEDAEPAAGETAELLAASGKCGEMVYWELNDAGRLRIYGSGAMSNYSSSGKVPWYGSRTSVLRVDIEAGVTSIGSLAFYECTKLTNVSIPEGVTSIGKNAFCDCDSLKSVVIPKGVKSIGNYAFQACDNLTSVSILEGVTSIGQQAFYNCGNLASVTLPKSVTSIGYGAFYSTSLTKVYYGGTESDWKKISIDSHNEKLTDAAREYESFGLSGSCGTDLTWQMSADFKTLTISGTGAMGVYTWKNGLTLAPWGAFYDRITTVTVESGVTSLANAAFFGCTALTSASLPEGLTSISSWAFDWCTGLKTVNIPESVTSIGDYAFYVCRSLKSVTIPQNVASIGSWAFGACGALTAIRIPEGVTSINFATFSGCAGLESVTLPLSVTSVGDDAFKSCDALKDVYYAGSESDRDDITINESGNDTFVNAEWHYEYIPAVSVTGVKLNPTTAELEIGGTLQLSATVNPVDAGDRSVTWKSSDTSVATVSSSGVVTAEAAGTATITVTTKDGGKEATCEVTVKASVIAVTGVRLNMTEATLEVGEGLQLTANVSPANATDRSVTWRSSDDFVASVDSTGYVTAGEAGTATITVTTKDGGIEATCELTVEQGDIAVTGVRLNTTDVTLDIGDTLKLTATVSPSNATNKGVMWESSDTSVASVDSTGLVTAEGAGTATITVTTKSGSKEATCEVTVKQSSVAVSGVKLNQTAATLVAGETLNLMATVSPSNATNKNVTWKSSKSTVASVSSAGVVTAKKAGTATITVTTNDGSRTAACTVTVKGGSVAVTGVKLNKTTAALVVGDTLQLTATVSPTDATNKNVTWKSSKSTVASVSSTGLVTAKKAGTATITVTTKDGSKKATCTVTVSAGKVAVTGVKLNKTSATLAVGKTLQLKATLSPANATNQNVTWKSSKTTVATVSSTGLVTAKKAGTATITVTTKDGSKKATCTVTVSAGTVAVTGVKLNKTSATLDVGETLQLTATVSPAKATNKNVTWKSSKSAVATVSSTGLVTAKAEGTATITVTTKDGSKKAICTVTVEEEEAEGFTVKFSYQGATEKNGPDRISVIYSQPYGELPEPTRLGKAFAGWWTKKSGGELITENSTFYGNGDQTLYAHWDVPDDDQYYIVTLNTNGGTLTGDNKISVKLGEKYGHIPDPFRDGYEFLGWYTQQYGGVMKTEDSRLTEQGDQTLWAQWKKESAASYKITFEANGGVLLGFDSTTLAQGDNYIFPTVIREGFIFTGWYRSRTSEANLVTEGTVFTGRKAETLYAHWEAISDGGYLVRFNAQGGTLNLDSKRLGAGERYGYLPTPWREG